MPRFLALVPLATLLLAGVLGACAASQDAATSSEVVWRPLPLLSVEDPAWTALQQRSAEAPPSAEACKEALAAAEAWWWELRERSQDLFTDQVAPDEETIRAWTLARRLFFERYLGSPVAIFVLQDGALELNPEVATVFVAWADCADDVEAGERWRGRSAAPRAE